MIWDNVYVYCLVSGVISICPVEGREDIRLENKMGKKEKERPYSCLSVFSKAQSGSNQGDAGMTALNYSLISQQTGEANESCVSRFVSLSGCYCVDIHCICSYTFWHFEHQSVPGTTFKCQNHNEH